MRWKNGTVGLLFMLIAGCTPQTTDAAPAAESASSPGSSSTTTTAAFTTTTHAPETALRPFVNQLREAQTTSDIAQVREVVSAESPHIYGQDQCQSYLRTALPEFPNDFEIVVVEDYLGLTQFPLDDIPVLTSYRYLVTVVFSTPTNEEHRLDLMMLTAQLDPVAMVARGPVALVDCGEPIAGITARHLAEVRATDDDYDVSYSFDTFIAPPTWWLEFDARNSRCHVTITDEATSEVVLDFTAGERVAGKIEHSGPLSIATEGTCPRVSAYADSRLVQYPIRGWELSPGDPWIPHIFYPGEHDDFDGEALVIVSGGETDVEMAGWWIEDTNGETVYRFADGFVMKRFDQVYLFTECGDNTTTESYIALYWCHPDAAIWSEVLESPGSATLYNADGEHVDGIFYGTGTNS